MKGEYSCKMKDGRLQWDDPGSQVSLYFGINSRNVGKVTDANMKGISYVIIHEGYDPKGWL